MRAALFVCSGASAPNLHHQSTPLPVCNTPCFGGGVDCSGSHSGEEAGPIISSPALFKGAHYPILPRASSPHHAVKARAPTRRKSPSKSAIPEVVVCVQPPERLDR